MLDNNDQAWLDAVNGARDDMAEDEGYGADDVPEQPQDIDSQDGDQAPWNVANVAPTQQAAALGAFYEALGYDAPEMSPDDAAQMVQRFYHDPQHQAQFLQHALRQVVQDIAQDLPKNTDPAIILAQAQRELRKALTAAERVLKRAPKGPTLAQRVRNAPHREGAFRLAAEGAEKETGLRFG